MTSRVGDIGSLVFERGRRGSVRRALVILLIVASLILYVAGKVSIVQLGYRIEALEREKKELERANRSLRIEASSLSAPARIEEIATKRMGMVRPPKENVVTVKRKAASAE
ncbi:MAG: cell division protein FtsL [Nitrospirae bacterium GWD2_57_9]|nr:MAG: cell division protein FtsL [Nitrospirae bacterium GWD2_57_9]OGW50828.1 MAG: cell division protein FtsL [Nitrospirae bacterium GWC2_57_9]